MSPCAQEEFMKTLHIARVSSKVHTSKSHVALARITMPSHVIFFRYPFKLNVTVKIWLPRVTSHRSLRDGAFTPCSPGDKPQPAAGCFPLDKAVSSLQGATFRAANEHCDPSVGWDTPCALRRPLHGDGVELSAWSQCARPWVHSQDHHTVLSAKSIKKQNNNKKPQEGGKNNLRTFF